MKKLSKIFAVVLALAMVLSVLPLGAGAIAATAGATATLVTDVSTLAANDQIVIVAKDENLVMSTNQKTNNRGAAQVTKSGNTVTLTADAEVLTLKAGASAGTFAFAVADGSYLYAAGGSSKNYLKTGSTLNATASFTIAIAADGVATITCADSATTRNLFRYNPNNGSPLFACYASGQQDVCIYKLAAAVQDTRVDLPTATADIVNAIFALNAGEALDKYYKYESFTMSGTIVTATEVWNEQYNNGTVTIKVDGTDKELVVFRYKAGTVDVEEIKALAVGDKVTFNVTRAENYSGTFELSQPTLTAIVKATNNDDTNNDDTNNDDTNNDNTNNDNTEVQPPKPTGDNTAIVAMTSVMAVAVVALAVLVIGKKRMF